MRRAKGREPRSTLTVDGRVSVTRRRWRAGGGEGGGDGGGPAAATPADAWLDAAEATVSRGTRELCCRLNAGSRSFARAAADLKHAARVTVSAEKLRQVVEAEGRRVLASAESGALRPGWAAAECQVMTPAAEGEPPVAVSRVYLGVDGFMAPLATDAEKRKRRAAVVSARRKRDKDKPKLPPLPARRAGADQRYKEFKLVQFHDEPMAHRLVSVTRGDCQAAGRIMRRDAGRVGFHDAHERVGNVDAAAWILGQVTARCILLTALVLDFYHLSEHVNEAKRATFGEGGAAGAAWAGAVLHAAKHGGFAPFWDQLLSWRSGLRGKAKRASADALLHYAGGHREMIRYDECVRRGWRISSSATESECGAIPKRVKGPGKRWDADNAEAVMALEATDQSGLWDAYWAGPAAGIN